VSDSLDQHELEHPRGRGDCPPEVELDARLRQIERHRDAVRDDRDSDERQRSEHRDRHDVASHAA